MMEQNKNLILKISLLFCTVGGIIPVFLPLFPVILITRCFYGMGCGLLMSSLLTLTVALFTGETRSSMIGFSCGVSGVGSAGFFFGGFANGYVSVWVGAVLFGYGYQIFVPYIQEQASRNYGAYGETATNFWVICIPFVYHMAQFVLHPLTMQTIKQYYGY